MKLKIICLVTVAVVISTQIEISDTNDRNFVAMAHRELPIDRNRLYQFVTHLETVDKWLDWITCLSEVDHKPLGVAKLYQVQIKNISIFFAVKKIIDGQYLLMESNFIFRPRVELLVSDGTTTRTSTANVSCPINDTSSDCNSDRCSSSRVGDNREPSNAKIAMKISFNRNSILFQYTLGVMFRVYFEKRLQQSMEYLEAMIVAAADDNLTPFH